MSIFLSEATDECSKNVVIHVTKVDLFDLGGLPFSTILKIKLNNTKNGVHRLIDLVAKGSSTKCRNSYCRKPVYFRYFQAFQNSFSEFDFLSTDASLPARTYSVDQKFTRKPAWTWCCHSFTIRDLSLETNIASTLLLY